MFNFLVLHWKRAVMLHTVCDICLNWKDNIQTVEPVAWQAEGPWLLHLCKVNGNNLGHPPEKGTHHHQSLLWPGAWLTSPDLDQGLNIMGMVRWTQAVAEIWTRGPELLSGEPWLLSGRSTSKETRLASPDSELKVVSSPCWTYSSTQIAQGKPWTWLWASWQTAALSWRRV